MKKKTYNKLILPIIILVATIVMLWLHYESIIHNIITDYGMDPFTSSVECEKPQYFYLPPSPMD
jgi:hypothetical protein